MEKYNKIIEGLKEMKEFQKGIDFNYDGFIDSILITFYNLKTFKKLNNAHSKVWKSFKGICCKYSVNYKLLPYGAIELYF